MALSKDYTLTIVRGILLLWQKEINISKLDPDLVDDFINLAVMDVFAKMQEAIYKEYGRTTTIVDSGAAFQAAAVVGTGFTHSTKNIEETAHGLTSASIGKRVLFHQTLTASGVPSYMTIATIVSITDVDNFVVSHSPGIDLPASGSYDFYYCVLPAHSDSSLDLSALRINRVRKLTDSITGECVEVKDARDFENLSKFPQKQNKIYWYQNGEIISLYKGSSVSAYGTLTLDYFGKPVAVSADADYLDLKDEHIPLAIQKAQDFIISHLTKTGQKVPAITNTQMVKQSESIEEQKDLIKK